MVVGCHLAENLINKGTISTSDIVFDFEGGEWMQSSYQVTISLFGL